jgi:hypothetical protein
VAAILMGAKPGTAHHAIKASPPCGTQAPAFELIAGAYKVAAGRRGAVKAPRSEIQAIRRGVLMCSRGRIREIYYVKTARQYSFCVKIWVQSNFFRSLP